MSEDRNLAKIKIPPAVKKAFNEGQIAEVYREIYRLAEELSADEAKRFRRKKLAEGVVSLRKALDDGEELVLPSINEIRQQTVEYRTGRLDLHIKEMVRLLESHARRKLGK
jgi:hypothetical protein